MTAYRKYVIAKACAVAALAIGLATFAEVPPVVRLIMFVIGAASLYGAHYLLATSG